MFLVKYTSIDSIGYRMEKCTVCSQLAVLMANTNKLDQTANKNTSHYLKVQVCDSQSSLSFIDHNDRTIMLFVADSTRLHFLCWPVVYLYYYDFYYYLI